MNANDRAALTEIIDWAKIEGEDEIAADAAAALAGDRDAFGYIKLDVQRREDMARWR